MENFTTGALYGYSFANESVSEYFKFSYTVPLAPSMVPTQEKMLSPSGKAEMPASEEVIRDISSVCNLRLICFLIRVVKRKACFIVRSKSFFFFFFSSKRGKGGEEEITKKKRKAEKMCFRKRARNTIARTKKRLSKRTFSRRSRYPNSHFDSYPISRLVNPRRVAVASRTFFYWSENECRLFFLCVLFFFFEDAWSNVAKKKWKIIETYICYHCFLGFG